MIKSRLLLYTRVYEKINLEKTIKIGCYAKWKSKNGKAILAKERRVIHFNCDEEQTEQLDYLIRGEQNQGIIRVNNQHEVLLLNRTFAIKKPEGGLRKIMDCRPLNTQLKAQHFQVNDLNEVQEVRKREDWACILDIKSVFNHVTVTVKLDKYLAFTHKGFI
ncbi:MAG: hypothetical protein EZS28_055752, partial [Streblomastix strix]